MPLTRAHAGGGAGVLFLATAALWLFFPARLSHDVVTHDVTTVPALPAPTRPQPAGAVTPALSDEAIRELRFAAEQAARETLLTNSR